MLKANTSKHMQACGLQIGGPSFKRLLMRNNMEILLIHNLEKQELLLKS